MKKLALIAGLVVALLGAVKATGVAGGGNEGQISYDSKGRPVRVTDSAGKSISLTYCTDDRTRACDVRWSTP